MTAHSRFRIAAAVGALVAPLALVATTATPADAGISKHKHEVYMYKVEKNVKLAGVGTDTIGDSEFQSVSCDPGDLVLDGMWSVKHVDQYNPPLPDDPDEDPDYPSTTTTGGDYNDERDVWIQASYPDQSDFRTWRYVLKNKAYGDAQVKLFLTCVRGYTEYTNSHRHQVEVRNLFGGSASTSGSAPRFYLDSSIPPWGTCGNDEYLVAPGFDLGAPDHRLVGSYPWNGGRSWVWEFATSGAAPAPASISVYGRCIERRVFDGATPRHAIAMKHLPGLNFASWFQSYIPQDDPREVQFSCDQGNGSYHGYKAMVGWFWMGDHWDDNWFLGMEPRPKTRAFYFWNNHASPAQVKYGTLCINSRTSAPLV